MSFDPADSRYMLRAIELARLGQGHVEPNPMVGAVIVQEGRIVGEGWHQRFGGPHAEIHALEAAGRLAAGGAMYVSLEPCCHHGKTPPCTEALVAAGLARIVVAMRDPFPRVAGGGLKRLAAAGIDVELGIGEDEARELNAPYLKLLATQRPWIIAKWAMTLDGKIATRSGASKWISGESCRRVVHQLRGRVDAIVIGRRTAELDDPLLTARFEGSEGFRTLEGTGATLDFASVKGSEPAMDSPPRIAMRIVLDSLARLPSSSKLVKTARQTPTLIVTGPEAPEKELRRLAGAGCEVLPFAPPSHYERLLQLLDELGRRRMTNILVEGGSELLGSLFDARQIDEVHTFLAAKIFGGQKAPSPVRGAGVEQVVQAWRLHEPCVENLAGDIYVHGRIAR
jgi:diaminohydroxyphosphoribosylaminopyrimidine deaminase / 5-amino-6-(5-phosphoribosylamino)uracil reductase